MNYLAEKRIQRTEAAKQYGAGSSLEGLELDGSVSEKKKKAVADTALNKILNDKSISEYERMEAVRLRAEQIE